MSLLRPLIRATAVAALRQRTWAEDRVANSNMSPIGAAIYGMRDPATGKPVAKPYICVYTDTDDIVPVNNEFYKGLNRQLNLVLEIGVATAIRKTVDGPITIQFADTDEGLEWSCDVISFQCIAALYGDPYSQWGELFKSMAGNCRRLTSRRGGQTQSGIRFAARRLIFQLQPIFDLRLGMTLRDDHPARKFVEMAKASPPGLGSIDDGKMVENLIVTLGTPFPEWRQAQALLGRTEAEALALSPDDTPLPYPQFNTPPWTQVEIQPINWTEWPESPPPVSEIDITSDGRTTDTK